MKLKKVILMGAASLLLGGCVVSSIAPFYADKDVVFEPGVVGSWIADTNNNDNEIWRFDKAADSAYRFTMIKSDVATVMTAHAFKLRDQLFLDVASPDKDEWEIPAHYLLKVEQTAPTLKLAILDNGWLKDLVTKTPGAIRHHLVKSGDKDENVVLTADTAELQKFIRANLSNTNAWSEVELQREGAK